MIKDIVKDVMFLSQRAEKATERDKYIANDLLDTLKAHNPMTMRVFLTLITSRIIRVARDCGSYIFTLKRST